ncbi:T9SS type A sorting domain-containing protein [Winogradskyella ursingii]|uniref:T9SS type A sorting domain-containing protein n=1 Tax=Winogradskyella ursingii TaxID=2686079 RepID=UPI0015C84D01|nr:T9SS type A sorting domain-containing protein [Winogradskyella ursingii]
MKKHYFILAAMLTFLTFNLALAQTTVASDDFSYPDGALVGNGSWANESGTAGTLLVSGGQALVSQDNGSEDAELKFADDLATDVVTATFDIVVTAPGAITGTDFEYFAHFSNDTNTNFRSRVDVIAPTLAGDYTLGLSASSSTNEVFIPVDFSFGAVVSVELSFDLDSGISSLTAGGQTVTSAGSMGEILDTFNLRQSSSSSDETIAVDNLVVTYSGTLSLNDLDKSSVKLFPNPVQRNTDVTITSLNEGPVAVIVYDVLGKLVKNEKLNGNTLNISDLNTGVYIVKITQNNASITKKLVIE